MSRKETSQTPKPQGMPSGVSIPERLTINRQVIEDFRTNEGKSTGRFEGVPLVLLHTVGAKSGKPGVNPLYLFEHDGRRYVTASFSGNSKTPAWAINARAQGEVIVEMPNEQYRADIVEVPEHERRTLYAQLAEEFPPFQQYQHRTERVIPMFELVRK
ncbi:nitroreductase family deazaflavin-dependent oxidoreductase [Mycobacteroides abscessus]|nr:nitroreductase family deazaflavin-dependent oxidoreductase [Mycobacteroides abscessus]MDM2427127.1 nitroreductase family deazaflavin-dependent oxidoreductase [Mycobacteroides abscessus]MDM2432206.1 nitroreductase family deazaflavin-dependent oxidoreductase [Mycobacteroides abscessus]MDM2436723.1 nitroreductase family deazaflavin-dependent oxidoreductase [Mycobacteroides abscessus]MDM2438667.1 nitroreductase family deazaflavin-dependent oxidoreductase [Mycobacteroides abscessus]